MNFVRSSILVLMLLCLNLVQAQFIKLLPKEKNETKPKKKKPEKNSNSEQIYSKIYEQNKRIEELLQRKLNRPYIWEGEKTILTGKILRGTLLNSIVSTNLASPLLIKINSDQGYYSGTKVSCFGTTVHERVHAKCNKIIKHNRELLINAQLLNQDGSSGLLGDYDDGKDSLIAGAIISDFAQGVIASSKRRISTPFGLQEDNTVSNNFRDGVLNSGETVTDILVEDLKNKEPIVTIQAGKQVLVYFQEKLDEDYEN